MTTRQSANRLNFCKSLSSSPDFTKQQQQSGVHSTACAVETKSVQNVTYLLGPFTPCMRKLNICLCLYLPEQYLSMWTYKLESSHLNIMRISGHCCSFAFFASQRYLLFNTSKHRNSLYNYYVHHLHCIPVTDLGINHTEQDNITYQMLPPSR